DAESRPRQIPRRPARRADSQAIPPGAEPQPRPDPPGKDARFVNAANPHRLWRPYRCPAEPQPPEQAPARRHRPRLRLVAEPIEIDARDRHPALAEPQHAELERRGFAAFE